MDNQNGFWWRDLMEPIHIKFMYRRFARWRSIKVYINALKNVIILNAGRSQGYCLWSRLVGFWTNEWGCGSSLSHIPQDDFSKFSYELFSSLCYRDKKRKRANPPNLSFSSRRRKIPRRSFVHFLTHFKGLTPTIEFIFTHTHTQKKCSPSFPLIEKKRKTKNSQEFKTTSVPRHMTF
jgi:hypothetical protein